MVLNVVNKIHFSLLGWLTSLAWRVTLRCSKVVKFASVFRTSAALPWIMGLQTFISKGYHNVFLGWLEGCTWNMVSCTPICWIYCVTLTVYTQFTNMAAGRRIHSSGPLVGDPCLGCYFLLFVQRIIDKQANRIFWPSVMRRRVWLCAGTNISEDHATYTFSVDILLGILGRKGQQTPPKVWIHQCTHYPIQEEQSLCQHYSEGLKSRKI